MISWVRCVLGQSQREAGSRQRPVDRQVAWSASSASAAGSVPSDGGRPAGARSRRAQVILPALVGAGGLLVLSWQLQRSVQLDRQLLSAKDQISRLVTHNQDLAKQLTEFQEERRTLDGHVRSLSANLSLVAIELEQAHARMLELQGISTALARERAEFETRMAHARAVHDTAVAMIERMTGERAEIHRSVDRLRRQLARLERDHRALERQLAAIPTARPGTTGGLENTALAIPATPAIALAGREAPRSPDPTASSVAAPADPPGDVMELPAIVIHQVQSGASPVTAQLVDVDQPHRFIIINRGGRDGVIRGMVFNLVRGATVVGRAVAVSVRPHLAACDIVQQEASKPVRIGDAAIQRDETE